MIMGLGDLSGGQQQIDKAFGVTPEQLRVESALLSTSENIHYEYYVAKLYMHTGGFPELFLQLQGGTEDKEKLLFVKECYEALKPVVDEWNEAERKKLIAERKKLVKQIQ